MMYVKSSSSNLDKTNEEEVLFQSETKFRVTNRKK